MSSFIVDNNTINKLVEYFIKCSYSEEGVKPQVYDILEELGYSLNYKFDDTNPNADNLFNDMILLNLKAVNYRYDEKNHLVKNKFKEVEETNIYQILKSLQCFLYQCSEGEMMKDKLFIALQKIEEILISDIISHLDEYKKAKWE